MNSPGGHGGKARQTQTPFPSVPAFSAMYSMGDGSLWEASVV